MTQVNNSEEIRELTNDEIGTVAGGGSFNFSSPIEQQIISVIDHIILCFENAFHIKVESDIALKHDITLLGHLDNGVGFYRFSYNGDDKSYVGVMAQEVEKVMPSAVVRGSDGYLQVYYDHLGLKLQTYDDWVASGAQVPAGTPIPH